MLCRDVIEVTWRMTYMRHKLCYTGNTEDDRPERHMSHVEVL